ncbi:DUF4381 domain-containing protein [Trichloromonas sp.]|uniref:DUF4381 domain-containing protein n=1 Tax=Trichloromonas sp. TaxID=3069249 RepID=UPI003D81A7D5
MPGVDPAAIAEALPLRDIHLPLAPGLWPPAPGWWLLTLLLALLILGFYLLARRARRLRYRRQALRQLAELEADRQLSPAALLSALSALLRRAMLCAFDREECAGLTGEAWLRFLDRDLRDAPFSTGHGRVLGQGPYQPECDFDRVALLALCRRRLKKLPAAPRQRRRA